MASMPRIPKAEVTGPLGYAVKRFSRKMLGDVPDGVGVMWHNRPVLMAMMGLGRKAEKWHQLDPDLKSFAHMAAVARVGCSFCLDFAYFQAHNRGLDDAKASEVPRSARVAGVHVAGARRHGLCRGDDRDAPRVTDELSARLLDQLGAPALVELTGVVAAANMAARGNTALGIESEGFSKVCRAAARAAIGRVRNLRMSDEAFARHRSLLFTVAYEILGSASDAEDVVQESWLRWAEVDHAAVRDPRAYLVRIVTRQALNRLRTVARRREEYVGEWLPEPLATSPDVAADVELAESVSIAMLTVLETLGHVERAVFVLRELFDTAYEEIAEAVDKSPAAVRQIAHRARQHVAARRPRASVSTTEQRAAVDGLVAAIRNGDLQGLLDVLAPDVVVVADGGGLVAAARRPIEGAERVAGLLIRGLRSVDFDAATIWLNGSPAVRIEAAGGLNAAVSVAVENGRITRVYVIANPHKLARLDTAALLTRT